MLENLDFYLERFERKVTEAGGHVHWCRTADEARETILGLCRNVGAKTVTKGKSMIAEEIALNDFLEEKGIEPIETDLGEYIIQLRREPPSHIIAPAIHLNKSDVIEAFHKAHTHLDPDRPMEDPNTLLEEARGVLRPKFLAADVGITGANFMIAETGSTIIVTNEGNGDLTQILPKVHIVLASLEKLVPTFEDAATILRLLARSATGQSSRSTPPSRPARGGRATSTGRNSSTSSSSTTAAPTSSAPSSRRCCAASAARPASTIARSTPPSVATPMAGSIRGRWARC